MKMLRRTVVWVALAAGLGHAHPLGNLSTNRQARLVITPGVVRVGYVVDMAELPAYRTLATIDADGDGRTDEGERTRWAARLADEVAQKLAVTLDGERLRLRPLGHAASLVPGAGGLPTLRADVELEAPLARPRGTLVVRDDVFAGLPGWQAILAQGRDGSALVESTAATDDPTDGLRAYPSDRLAAPPAVREARIVYAPGVAAPTAGPPIRRLAARTGDRLTALVEDDQPLSTLVLLGALGVAVVLGALHALTPGHGKTIVGAYLVGTRGTWKHAVLLGLLVTATHTAGVYALGAATLLASTWFLPERLLPWLAAISGVLVIAVAASLVRERLAAALHGHDHGHRHHHHGPTSDAVPGVRSLVALGVSGGLLPCPSALVVMLGAIAVGRTAFGLVLVAAFSIGLAAVLTTIGLVLVHARALFDRLPVDGRVARFAPVASAAIISLAGLAILVEAMMRIHA
jgi:ABC-type nickel/cobalt efflux system permease component RcnA